VVVVDSFYELTEYVEFKLDFHHVFMHARKDPEQKWYVLPYLATNNVIAAVLNRWTVD